MIGEQIRKLRNELHLSQKKFGEGLHVSQSLINAIENNYREATDRFIEDVCRVYGVNKSWLLKDTPPMFTDPLDGVSVDDEVKELTRLLMQLSPEERNSIVDMVKTFNKGEDTDGE